MTKWPAILVLICVALTIGFFACEEEGDDDDDDDDDDIPAGVFDFIDQEDLDAIEGGGMPIHLGNSPPNIEGVYALDSLIILYYSYDESIEGVQTANGEITYHDQTTDGGIQCDDYTFYHGDFATGNGGFISGSGDCYSVYLQVTGEMLGCAFEAVSVHSGCLGNEGIEDFYWGGIMKERASGGDCDKLNPVDSVFLVYESDGLAAEVD